MKTCNKCGEMKSLEEFHKRAASKDGRQSHCQECHREYRKRYDAENAEVKREYRKRYYAENAEAKREYRESNRERIAEYQKRWRAENAEVKREYQKRWYAENIEARREYSKRWYAENPDASWRSLFRRRAKKYGYTDRIIEEFTRSDLTNLYGNACFHCGGEFEELDHYPVPVSQGGHHTLENARPSCSDCNRQSWREEQAA